MGLLNDEKPLEENTATKEPEIKQPEEKPKEEVKADQDDGGMDAFLEGLKNKTDKDEIGGVGSGTGSGTGSTGTGTGTGSSAPAPRRSGMNYANHELVAKLTIAAMSVTFGLLLQYVAQDFSEEAEKRYKLSDGRKKELEEPLTLMLEQSKSKYNPAVIFFITVLISYVPMFIGAFRIRKKNAQLKGANKKLPKDITLQWSEETKDNIMNEALQRKEERKPEQKQTEQRTIGRAFTADQRKRIEKIKKQRGRRSVEDQNFINEMGLKGLI